MLSNVPATHGPYYWCGGFVVTGLAFIAIGFGIGRIGREARKADAPTETVLTTPIANDGRHGVTTAPVATAPQGTVPVNGTPVVKQTTTSLR